MNHINPLDVVEQVKKNGFFVIRNFFSDEEANSLKLKFKKVYSLCKTGDQIDIPGKISPNAYSTGKSARIYPEFYNEFIELTKFKNPLLSEMSDLFFNGCSNKGLQTFSSYEYLCKDQVDSLPRNSYMHVDPYHSFKFFSYLMDTDKYNGALQVIPGTSWIGKSIREENTLESMLNSDSYTFAQSKHYTKNLEDQTIYISGKAGDLIILDTDVMHCGGIILSQGLERLSIVYHNRK